MLFFNRGVSFNPKTDIPSLEGKVILVTGGNSGLGKQSVLEFARHEPAQIWLAARDSDKAKTAIDDVRKEVPNANIKHIELDLTSLDSVRNAAKTLLEQSDRLDLLLLNAGIMASPPGLTQDGLELQFGVNHVAHALLTKLLMPLLLKTAEAPNADVRVIVLSSVGHNMSPKEGIQFENVHTKCDNVQTWTRYGQSKLANALFARELAKRYPQLKTAAVHPGAVNTNLGRYLKESYPFLSFLQPLADLLLTSIESGTKNQLWASVSKDVVSGEYYTPVGVHGNASPQARDDALARKLWEWTEEELKAYEV
ncbi:putative short-chain dehydrogenase reductase protein [Phaeoacremonium minimum UCRPA7]|uniref:Putative short-chain dehydrogenase reductase protein n=1 Tax=Phaeoacremonium minimum (strain UCR-PA7) TaxID=1286976 RepID=R8BK32_PHAM7|nr:putative short-chain dehydrogenase reductase protein [Phaeoacremonium minimum UCRPA7]EON99713.1 putative short-chain dehydrogenase reductase protein [Phaeoacremonium minimum UCRPA7]